MTLAVFNSAAFETASGVAVAANATIEVRRESDSGLASIYSDEDALTSITNPSAFADSSGRFKFYAAGLAGGYSVQVTSGAESFTLRNVAIGNAAQYDTQTFKLAGHRPDYTLQASVGLNQLTLELKHIDGTDPTAINPLKLQFRNSAIDDGSIEEVTLTTALNFSVGNGSHLATTNGVPHRLYVALINNGGSIEIGIYNPWDVTTETLIALDPSALQTSVAEGTGTATLAHVLYSDTAITSKAIALVGYIESTQATAGTWVTAPSKVHALVESDYRTGDVVQSVIKRDGAVATGTTTVPADDTKPQQSTEGDEYISATITPKSAINLLDIDAMAMLSVNVTGANMVAALHQDSAEDAIAATNFHLSSSNRVTQMILRHFMVAGTSSATTFKYFAGSGSGTMTFNGAVGARYFAGVANSFLSITEIFV